MLGRNCMLFIDGGAKSLHAILSGIQEYDPILGADGSLFHQKCQLWDVKKSYIYREIVPKLAQINHMAI
jgi:hypothetical protein